MTIFRRKLKGILSSLTNTVKSLDSYVDQSVEDLGQNEIKLVQLENKRDEISDDITQAQTVSSNLKVLLGVEQ